MPISNRIGHRLLPVILLLLCARELGAQGPVAGPTGGLDSLLVRLDQVTTPAGLPDAAVCPTQTSTMTRLCTGLIALRRSEISGAEDDVIIARTLLERVATDEPKWALAWLAVGRMRLQAQRAGVIAREGPLQYAGTANVVGAAAAFRKGLTIDTANAALWILLATTPVPWNDKKGLRERVAALRRGRSWLPIANWVDEALVELDAGSVDTAIALLRGALEKNAPGVARGMAQITLARALYRIGKPKDGRAALLAGAAESDSAGIREYREQISWVGDSTEMKTWARLAPEARSGWLAAFWAKRDALEGRGDGERLIEHYRRVNIAYDLYRMVLPSSGQQLQHTSIMEAPYARWLNRLCGPGIVPGLWCEYVAGRQTVGAQSPFVAFRTGQSILDDRGLIFIRHGEPTSIASAIPGEVVVGSVKYFQDGASSMAIWRYDRPSPDPPLILSFANQPFQGSTEPNVLVPTLFAEDPATRLQLCTVDQSLCPTFLTLGEEVAHARLTLDMIQQAAMTGKAYINTAVTSDRFVRVFTSAIHASVESHLLDQAQGGAPRLVIGFAVPGTDIKGDSIGGGGFSYQLHVQVMAVRQSDGMRVDMDTVRRFPMSRRLQKGEFLSSLVELPLPPGRWVASMVLTQSENLGMKLTFRDLPVRGWSSELAVSDIVLGREESGLRWHSGPGGQSVPFNPFNTFPAKANASLYAQISGLKAGASYNAKVELFAGKDEEGKPVLSIAFNESAAAERAEFSRELGLSQLEPGRYLVRLTITSGNRTAVGTGGLEILKP